MAEFLDVLNSLARRYEGALDEEWIRLKHKHSRF